MARTEQALDMALEDIITSGKGGKGKSKGSGSDSCGRSSNDKLEMSLEDVISSEFKGKKKGKGKGNDGGGNDWSSKGAWKHASDHGDDSWVACWREKTAEKPARERSERKDWDSGDKEWNCWERGSRATSAKGSWGDSWSSKNDWRSSQWSARDEWRGSRGSDQDPTWRDRRDDPWQGGGRSDGNRAHDWEQKRSNWEPESRSDLTHRSEKRGRDPYDEPELPLKKIRVSNLPRSLDWRDIKEAFETEAGKIVRCEVDGTEAGITFDHPDDARQAVETFDRGELNGRTIGVQLVR